MYLKTMFELYYNPFLTVYGGICPLLEAKKKLQLLAKFFIAPPAATPSTLLP